MGLSALFALLPLQPIFGHQAEVWRRVSISRSQPMIWFQLGMFWDANILKV